MTEKYALVIVQDEETGRILLGRKRSKFRNKYEEFPIMLPGGGMKANETPREAAVRELGEEVDKKLGPERFEALGTFFNALEDKLFYIFHLKLKRTEYREKIPPHSEFVEKFFWRAPGNIPYDEMKPEHGYWLPKMLKATKPLKLVLKKELVA